MNRGLDAAEVARQTQLIADVATLSQAIVEGRIDDTGRLLGRAIDNFPEIEAGLLNATALGLNLFATEAASERDAERARSLALSASSRIATLMNGAPNGY